MKPRFKFKRIFTDPGVMEIDEREKNILASMTPSGREANIERMRRARGVSRFSWEREVESRARKAEKEIEDKDMPHGRKKVALPSYLGERRHQTRRERSR